MCFSCVRRQRSWISMRNLHHLLLQGASTAFDSLFNLISASSLRKERMVVIWAKLIKLAILLSHEMIHHLSAEKQIRMITISKQGHTRTKKKWKKKMKNPRYQRFTKNYSTPISKSTKPQEQFSTPFFFSFWLFLNTSIKFLRHLYWSSLENFLPILPPYITSINSPPYHFLRSASHLTVRLFFFQHWTLFVCVSLSSFLLIFCLSFWKPTIFFFFFFFLISYKMQFLWI